MTSLVEKSIYEAVHNTLNPEVLLVENESHMHSVPKNSETHFKLTVVSTKFIGLTRVSRHQLVYGLTQQHRENGLHALALHLYSPEEWERKSCAVPASPQCMGGSKSKSANRSAPNTAMEEQGQWKK